MGVLEDLLRGAAAIGIAGGFALASYVTGALLAGARRPLVRWLASGLALTWIATVGFHALSSLRLFGMLPAVILSVGLGLIAWRAVGGGEGMRCWMRRDARFLLRAGRLVRGSRHRLWILSFCALAAPGLLRAFILPPLGWDTLTYHGVKAAMWVQNGGVDSMVGTGPWGYYRNMLAGAEVFTAWAMLPLRADTLTGLLEVGEWLALGLAVLVLARELGAREPLGSAAAAVVLSVPTVFTLPGSGYVELALLLTFVGSLASGIRGLRDRPGLLLLAGAGLGVSASTKLPMVPSCGIVLALLAAVALVRGTRRSRAFALAGVAAFLAALVPWLLLSYQRTGAPFSPIPIQVGSLVLGRAAPELAWMASRPLPDMTWFAREGAVLVRVFHPPVLRTEALGLLALVPLAAAPFGFLRLGRRNSLAFVLVACAAAVSGVLFFSPGLASVRLYWPISSSRFLLPFWTLTTVVSVAAAWRGPARFRHLAVLLRAVALFQLAACFGYGFSGRSWFGALLAGAGVCVLGAAATFTSRRRSVATRAGVWVVAILAGILLLTILRDGLRQDLLQRDFVIHEDRKDWAVAVPFVDVPDDPRVIAVTSGPKRSLDNWFAYPFLGRRLQNSVVYIPVSWGGEIRPFGDEAALEEFQLTADFDAWRRRLDERGVTEVMSFEPGSLELSWMEGRPGEFDRLCGQDGRWGLYRLRTPTSRRDTPGS